MRIALMLRNVNSQTNVKVDINYVNDHQNMQEHNNNKELGISSSQVTYLSIREYLHLRHRCPFLLVSKRGWNLSE